MKNIKDQLETHIKLFSKIDEDKLHSAAILTAECFLNGGKLYICGSGHYSPLGGYISSMFMNRCIMPRPPMPAISLNGDISYSSDDIYEKQVTALITPIDMVWGLSAYSEDIVVKAMRAAARQNVKNIGFFGKNSENMHGICDISLSVEHSDIVRVLEIHLVMVNIICDAVDHIIFGKGVAE
jgi:phosphoheptose isomerase